MRVWVKGLESVETRYTSQWKDAIPKAILKAARSIGRISYIVKDPLTVRQDIDIHNAPDKNVVEITSLEGEMGDQETTPGAFLNFGGTNIWKSTQLKLFAECVQRGLVRDGDQILIADAWDPTILQIKYMLELVPGLSNCKIHAIWHAGSYDPQDFLGRLIGDVPWVRHTEKALYHSIDHNYFATGFHIDLFFGTLFKDDYKINKLVENKQKAINSDKIIKSGQPHNVLVEALEEYSELEKENIILFPHRLAPEKQVEIFRDLANYFPEYKFIICQEQKLTKHQYHEMLGKAKFIFSANLQETLGISAMEGILCNAVPILPNRLSYTEMYDEKFLYPSKWTTSFDAYSENKDKLIDYINHWMNHYDAQSTKNTVKLQKETLLFNYLSATHMIDTILGA